MASTPLNRTKPTTSNSPYSSRSARGHRSRSLPESCCLTLQRVIGSTCCSPTGFDTVNSSFAYIAGGAVVVVDVSENSYSQRFFRARPNAVPLLSSSQASNPSSTQSSTPKSSDSRGRVAPSPRDGTTYQTTDWSESSPTSKTWTSRERIKAATCLALSRDGRFLAVGETGYAPRVLIFSLQEASSDIPLVSISEHTFGVRAVSWSPDGKYLASLGSANDGFLYLWKVDSRTGAMKLFQQNRCTSFVKHMVWMGPSLITLGVRHVKLWRVDDTAENSLSKQKLQGDSTAGSSSAPASFSSASAASASAATSSVSSASSTVVGTAAAAAAAASSSMTAAPPSQPPQKQPLQGRNILLGSMLEATFCCALPISDEKAIICSETGAVCLLEDTGKQPKFAKLLDLSFPISCLSMRGENVYIGGKDGQLACISLESILAGTPEPTIRTSQMVPGFMAMGFLADHLVTIDSKRSIDIWSPDAMLASSQDDSSTTRIPIPGLGDPVVGIQRLAASNSLGASFFTWSSAGRVTVWDMGGLVKATLDIPIEQVEQPVPNGTGGSDPDAANQLVVAKATNDGTLFITGDKLGVLRIVDVAAGECLLETKAHSSDFQDISVLEGESRFLLASCGKDRTVQLFHRSSSPLGEFEHFQTLEFSAKVVQVLIPSEDKVLTCSLDRTLQIYDLVSKEGEPDVIAAIPFKTISLRASPSSMTTSPDNKSIFVSLLDRTVCQFDAANGRLLSSFKCSDEAGHDSVVLESLTYGLIGSYDVPFLLGISNTDKSIRIYEALSGAFLDREWGHTEAINGVVLIDTDETGRKVVSVGEDGTIMVWGLEIQEPIATTSSRQRDPSPEKTPGLTSARPPLRRVLSKAELAEFQRSSANASGASTGRRSPPRGAANTPNTPTASTTNSRRVSRFHVPLSSVRTPNSSEKQASPSATPVPTTTNNMTAQGPAPQPAAATAEDTPSRATRAPSSGRVSPSADAPTPPSESPKAVTSASATGSLRSVYRSRPSLNVLNAITAHTSSTSAPINGNSNASITTAPSRKNSSSSASTTTATAPNSTTNGATTTTTTKSTTRTRATKTTGTNGKTTSSSLSKIPAVKYTYGSLSMATEQTCRQLRAFRKKLSADKSGDVDADLLAQLDSELRLTAAALGERAIRTRVRHGHGHRHHHHGHSHSHGYHGHRGENGNGLGDGVQSDETCDRHGHEHAKAPVSEAMLESLLDQYSERLVSLLESKLVRRLGMWSDNEQSSSSEDSEKEKRKRKEKGKKAHHQQHHHHQGKRRRGLSRKVLAAPEDSMLETETDNRQYGDDSSSSSGSGSATASASSNPGSADAGDYMSACASGCVSSSSSVGDDEGDETEVGERIDGEFDEGMSTVGWTETEQEPGTETEGEMERSQLRVEEGFKTEAPA